MKVCWIGVIGRPNVGKSTLINNLIKYDLSIVSNKPQTTRDQILGVITENDYQLIFIDTPGIHKPQSEFGKTLNQKAYETLKDVDLILFLQPLDQEISKGDLLILEKIKDIKSKIAVLTKKDLITSEFEIENKINELKPFNFDHIVAVSDKEKYSNLIDNLFELLKSYSYDGEQFYDENDITDRSELFLTKEIIRLSAIENLKDELPHSIAIEINNYSLDEKQKRFIEATIYCKKDSQKGIIVGKNGSMIKKIGTDARKLIIQKFGYPVDLRLQVKVNKNWINNESLIKKFGY